MYFSQSFFSVMHKKTAIVIGAGILGLAVARALSLKGYAVSVFDRNERALGASVRNFGMIWPIGQPSGKLYNWAIHSRNCWLEICKSSGLWCDPAGSLHLAYHEDEWIVLQELAELFSREGREVQLISPNQVSKVSSIAKERDCLGGLYSSEEIIVDPREAMVKLPEYFEKEMGVLFCWGKAITEVYSGYIKADGQKINADQIFICSGADFETLYPETFARFALTKCKLQMMRMVEEDSPRIGPAVCGGLSLIHYASFKGAASLSILRNRYEIEMPEFLKWGIHVMVSQNRQGQLTVGDSHEYGMAPDPFDRKYINDLILEYLQEFATLKNPRIIETWNGIYGKFTDGQTELFYSPDKDVFIVNGVGGAGMTLSFGFAAEKINSL
jgi:FAD dependent oxidoreductase TIGR03364